MAVELDLVVLAVLIGAGGGFGSYCLTCALHVWRKRNGRVAEDHVGSGIVKRLGRAASLLLLLGALVCLAAATISLLVSMPEGLLHGNDLLTIRTPKDLRADWTTQKEMIEPGDVIARFSSPEHEAKAKILRLTIRDHHEVRAALQKEPLEPDREITRRLGDMGNERRQLGIRLAEFQLERSVVERDLYRERLTHKNEIHCLRVNLAQLQRQLAQARADAEFDQKQALRTNALAIRGVETERSRENTARNVAVQTEEVSKLREQIDNTRAQETGLREDLVELTQVMNDQLTRFDGQIAALDSQLQNVCAREQEIQELLNRDMERAADLREHKLRLIDTDLQKAEQELAGLEASMQVTASFGGRVVYRSSSPQAEREGDPVLVVGPRESLRLCLRVPKWQRKAFERSSEIKLELVSQMDKDAEVERFFVERWFVGKPALWRVLPNDPSHALAELSCDPPHEAVRYLSSGNEILVKMHWRPSPLGNPVFWIGAVLSVFGAAGWTLTISRRRITADTLTASPSALRATSTRVDDEHTTRDTLHWLGTQLHEAVLRHKVEPDLLATIERALDRHNARAIRLIGSGLDGTGLGAALEQFLDQIPKKRDDKQNGTPSRADLRRLLRIVQTVTPDAITANAERIARQLDDHNAGSRFEWDGR